MEWLRMGGWRGGSKNAEKVGNAEVEDRVVLQREEEVEWVE
jgi:hypothetical protein